MKQSNEKGSETNNTPKPQNPTCRGRSPLRPALPNPQQLKIVPATTENLPQILEIGKESISADWTLSFLLADIDKEDTYFIAAIHGENALGFAVFREVGDDGELLQIATRKDARCSGVGSVLLESVLECAQSKSLHKVFLEVRKSNTPAIRLYEKFGFSEIRTRRAYYDNPTEDAIVMARVIQVALGMHGD